MSSTRSVTDIARQRSTRTAKAAGSVSAGIDTWAMGPRLLTSSDGRPDRLPAEKRPSNTRGALGRRHVLRASGEVLDDQDPSADENVKTDRVPNGANYGPFIRLPN